MGVLEVIGGWLFKRFMDWWLFERLLVGGCFRGYGLVVILEVIGWWLFKRLLAGCCFRGYW